MGNPTVVSSIDAAPSWMLYSLHSLHPHVIPITFSLIYLFCTGSIFFDVVHHLLHRCNNSSHPLFQQLARIHRYHHLYYTRHMDFNEKYRMQNLTQALPLELALQVIGTVLGYIFITLVTPSSRMWILQSHLWSIIGFQAVKMIFVILTSGRDSNHLIYETAPKDPNWIFVGPEFHALHHVYPDRYMGSFVKLFDWVWGTAYSFRGKRFVITGGNRSFGQAMVTELECEGVQNIRNLKFGEDWDHENFAKAASALSSCDILILAHTSRGEDAMKSNCDSAVRLVELFKQHREKNISNPTLPEVWYVGSEAEMLPPFGNAELQRYSDSKRRFLPHARSYYDDTEILYRHIMPSAVSSADWTAKCSMWWIRRGVRYIPISHTGIAYLNYFKFMYWTPYAQDMDRL